MGLIPVHSDVFPSKAFVMSGSGFSVIGDRLEGEGRGGIGNSRKRAVKKLVKKATPHAKKAAKIALDLAEQFGSDKQKKMAQDARLAGKIMGAGPAKPPLPAAKLRALLRPSARERSS